jgi:hypothetical protein
MTRRKFREDEFAVSERVVQAARMVLKAISLFNVRQQGSMVGLLKYVSSRTWWSAFYNTSINMSNSFISFYPFVAVFSLYYHIAVVVDPEECEEDIRSLELLCEVVRHAAADRGELTPVANALTALNGVCRTLQDSKRSGCYHPTSLTHQPSESAGALPRMTYPPGSHNPGLVSRIPGISSSMVGLVPLPADGLPFNGDFGMPLSHRISAGNPLEYMRELESDFVGRNWHDNWWYIDPVTGESARVQEPEQDA